MVSKKKRAESPQVVKNTEKRIDSVPFVVWFHKKVKANKLRAHQQNELKVYFTEKGLKDNEQESKFEDTLKSF